MLNLNFTIDEDEVTKCSGDQESKIVNEHNEITTHDGNDEADEVDGFAFKVKMYEFENELDNDDHYSDDGDDQSDCSIREINGKNFKFQPIVPI